VILSFALAACGTPAPVATEAPAAEAPAVEAPAATEAPVMEDVAIRWRTRPDNQEEIDVYSKISTELDAELNGVTLTYEPGGTEGANYQDQLKTEVAAGTYSGYLEPMSLTSQLAA
jgi:multiple sugar transport system substrate-binding protein